MRMFFSTQDLNHTMMQFRFTYVLVDTIMQEGCGHILVASF